MLHLRPPAVCLVDRNGLVEALLDDGPAEQRAVLGGKVRVEPVVSDSEGVGHLRGIQEVLGVPVGEGGRGAQFRQRAVKVPAVAIQAVEERQGVDAVQAAAAFIEQARPDELILHRRLGEDARGFLLELRVHLPSEGIGLEEAADAFQVRGGGDQARVRLAQRGERLPRLGRKARGGGQKADEEADHEALF